MSPSARAWVVALTACTALNSYRGPLASVDAMQLAVTPITLGSNLSLHPLLDYDWRAPVSQDADVVSLHEDAVVGVPWEHFLSGGKTPAPAFWTDHVAAMRKAATSDGACSRVALLSPVASPVLMAGGVCEPHVLLPGLATS